MSRWWWWPTDETVPVGRSRPVLFFPPAGADQTIAAPLSLHLPGVRFGVLRMPGRGTRQEDPPPTDLAALAGDIATTTLRLPGPAPMLVGHSFGSRLALVVARLLSAQGRPPSRLVVVAGTATGSEPGAELDEYVERRTGQLITGGGVPRQAMADPWLAEAAREALATDLRLSCQLTSGPPMPCPITVVHVRDDELLDGSAAASWSAMTTRPVDHVIVSGGHFFYRACPTALSRVLVAELGYLDDV